MGCGLVGETMVPIYEKQQKILFNQALIYVFHTLGRERTGWKENH